MAESRCSCVSAIDVQCTSAQCNPHLQNGHSGDRALLGHLTRLVRSSEDAAELLQETYLRVMAHTRSVEFESLARAYLFDTATNLARDHFRRQRWRAHDSLESVSEPEAPHTLSSPEELALWGEAVESLGAALRTMPETTRAVFTLARLDNRPYADIARELGIT